MRQVSRLSLVDVYCRVQIASTVGFYQCDVPASVVKSRRLCYFQESSGTCQKFYFLESKSSVKLFYSLES